MSETTDRPRRCITETIPPFTIPLQKPQTTALYHWNNTTIHYSIAETTDRGIVSLRPYHHSLFHRRSHRPWHCITETVPSFTIPSQEQQTMALYQWCNTTIPYSIAEFTQPGRVWVTGPLMPQLLTIIVQKLYAPELDCSVMNPRLFHSSQRHGMSTRLTSWKLTTSQTKRTSQRFLPTFYHQRNWADTGYNKLIIMQNIFTTSIATRLSRLWVSIAKATKTLSTLEGTELLQFMLPAFFWLTEASSCSVLCWLTEVFISTEHFLTHWGFKDSEYFADSRKSWFLLNTFWLTEASSYSVLCWLKEVFIFTEHFLTHWGFKDSEYFADSQNLEDTKHLT